MNNIFANHSSSSVAHTKHYCIVVPVNGYNWINGVFSDYNLYYTGGGEAWVGKCGIEEMATMAQWRNFTYCDNNSYDLNPQFESETDLHISEAIPTPVQGHGSYGSAPYEIDWVLNDIDGDLRDTSAPDIGADEGLFLAMGNAPLPASGFQPADLAVGIPVNQNPLLSWTINYDEAPFSDPTFSYTYLSTDYGQVNSLNPSALVQGDGVTLYDAYLSPVYLDPMSTYYWRVVIGNPAATVISDVFSFTTASEPVISSFPLTEGFEGASIPPTGWVSAYNWPWDGGLNGNNLINMGMGGWIPDSSPGNIHTGSYAATSPPFGQPSYDWLITPSIQFPSTSSPELGFWLAYNHDAGGPTTFYVQAYSGGVWTTLATYNTPAQSSHYSAEIVIDLSAYAGETIKLAFIVGPEMTFYPTSIDDIEIRVNYTGYYAYEGFIPIGETGIDLTAFALEDYDIDSFEFDTGSTSTEIRDVSLDFVAGESTYPVPDVSMIGFSCSGSISDPSITEALIHFVYQGARLTHAYQWNSSLSDWVEVTLLSDPYDTITHTGELVFYLNLGPAFRNRNTSFAFITAKDDMLSLGSPVNIQIEYVEDNLMRLSWEANSITTGYRIEGSNNPYSGWELLAEVNPNTHQWYINPLTSENCFYRIVNVWEP